MRKYVLPRFGYEWIEEIDGWCKDCKFDDDGELIEGDVIDDVDVEEHYTRETIKLFFGALNGR
jgi:hypothetical protein